MCQVKNLNLDEEISSQGIKLIKLHSSLPFVFNMYVKPYNFFLFRFGLWTSESNMQPNSSIKAQGRMKNNVILDYF